MKLPKRHRNHQLETESVRALQSKLPSTWVYRTPTDDYGIDGEIEIFDDGGIATGKKFLLQLKATDESDLEKALKLRLPVEKANYFDSLNLPVLVVRYLAQEKNIYVRWFHSFDPYWESITENSLAFNFSESNIWHEGRERSLEAELNEYLNFTGNKYPFPISLPIFFTSDFPMAKEAAKLAAEVITISDRYGDLIDLRFAPIPEDLPPSYIIFDSEKLHIVFANRTGSCLHFKDGLGEKLRGNISNDIFVAIGLGLFFRGFQVEAGRLLSDNIKASTLKHDIKVITAVISGLIQARQHQQALELMKDLFSEEDGIDAAQVALISIIRCFGSIKAPDKNLLSESLSQISSSLQERGINKIAAVIEYNHANFLRASNDKLKDALKHYNIASKLFHEYKERSYWLSEVAGCLFLLKRYRYASKYYKSSIDTEFSLHALGLYADTLMYSRQFKQSLDEFHRYFEEDNTDNFNAEWHLKSTCLHAIVETIGVEEQLHYDGEYDIESLIEGDEDSFIVHLKEKDALCGEVWFHLAISLTNEERYSDAVICFLMSAFCEHSEMDAWANALSCSFKTENKGMSATVMKCAFDKFGQEFILFFSETRPLSEDADPVEAQLKLVEMMQLLNETKPSNSDFEVRMHKPDGGYDKILPAENTKA
jgi:tetratricopeptide (TPR) repeat protein